MLQYLRQNVSWRRSQPTPRDCDGRGTKRAELCWVGSKGWRARTYQHCVPTKLLYDEERTFARGS